ncbi:MAG: NAD(P)/FAD-dependent oxidoreductase [Chloroflexi bacterium]|nr:NAD(P)/FAD-dependent oxidoreductase [Chloroflexota bacterium]
MPGYDVVVIGGGPAGYAAALKAAELGAGVALIEAERPGGACVHHSCIPTNIFLSSAHSFVEAQEQRVMGVFEAGEAFNFARAAARKDALVAKMAQGVSAALRMRKVKVIAGRAAFSGPSSVTVTGDGGAEEMTAQAFVVATGTRWEPPAIEGVPPDRVLTADAVQSLAVAPASALILGGGPADTAFALEYAFLLSVAGSEVAIATPGSRLLPGLDEAVSQVALGMLSAAGIRLFDSAQVRGEGDRAIVTHATGTDSVPAEIIVAADVRRPYFETLNLAAARVEATATGITVDRGCRTSNPAVFAAGDVTGQVMLSSSANHMGEVAGANAAGGTARTRLDRIPHLLHTLPEIGWIGLTEAQAKTAGKNVAAGVFDLSYNARAIALGAREGLVKVVADRDLGEILGVHVAGPGAAEIVNIAATLMQAEVTLADLAAMTYWHPSMAEGLVEAARRAQS